WVAAVPAAPNCVLSAGCVPGVEGGPSMKGEDGFWPCCGLKPLTCGENAPVCAPGGEVKFAPNGHVPGLDPNVHAGGAPNGAEPCAEPKAGDPGGLPDP